MVRSNGKAAARAFFHRSGRFSDLGEARRHVHALDSIAELIAVWQLAAAARRYAKRHRLGPDRVNHAGEIEVRAAWCAARIHHGLSHA
jgi:hypothetical protein